MSGSTLAAEYWKAAQYWFASSSNPGEFNWATTATQAIDGKDLTGKVCLVTGGNRGIGKETARVLLEANATVIIGSRSLQRGEDARQEILESAMSANSAERLKVLQLDLGDLNSVQAFSDQFNALDIPCHYLVQSAGLLSMSFNTTAQGVESMFGVNHLAHFQLTKKLMPRLQQDPPSRVICVASISHEEAPDMDEWTSSHGGKDAHAMTEEDFDAMAGYGLSKMCNLMFAQELNRRYSDSGVTAVSCHPGAIDSGLGRDLPWAARKIMSFVMGRFSKSEAQGAATQVRLVALSDDEIVPGAYYTDCQPAPFLKPECEPRPDVPVQETPQYKLWELTEQMISNLGF